MFGNITFCVLIKIFFNLFNVSFFGCIFTKLYEGNTLFIGIDFQFSSISCFIKLSQMILIFVYHATKYISTVLSMFLRVAAAVRAGYGMTGGVEGG